MGAYCLLKKVFFPWNAKAIIHVSSIEKITNLQRFESVALFSQWCVNRLPNFYGSVAQDYDGIRSSIHLFPNEENVFLSWAEVGSPEVKIEKIRYLIFDRQETGYCFARLTFGTKYLICKFRSQNLSKNVFWFLFPILITINSSSSLTLSTKPVFPFLELSKNS